MSELHSLNIDYMVDPNDADGGICLCNKDEDDDLVLLLDNISICTLDFSNDDELSLENLTTLTTTEEISTQQTGNNSLLENSILSTKYRNNKKTFFVNMPCTSHHFKSLNCNNLRSISVSNTSDISSSEATHDYIQSEQKHKRKYTKRSSYWDQPRNKKGKITHVHMRCKDSMNKHNSHFYPTSKPEEKNNRIESNTKPFIRVQHPTINVIDLKTSDESMNGNEENFCRDIICQSCNMTFSECHELVYGEYCLQHVKEQLKKSNDNMLTFFEIMDSYKQAYNWLLNTKIFHSISHEHVHDMSRPLPHCMLHGSYKVAVELLYNEKDTPICV